MHTYHIKKNLLKAVRDEIVKKCKNAETILERKILQGPKKKKKNLCYNFRKKMIIFYCLRQENIIWLDDVTKVHIRKYNFDLESTNFYNYIW